MYSEIYLSTFEDFRKFSTFSSLGSFYTGRVLQSQAVFGLSNKVLVVGGCRVTFCDKVPEEPLPEPVSAISKMDLPVVNTGPLW